MLVVVHYGVGNIGSITNMLKKVGAEAVVSSEAGTVERAKKLILSGVGSFDSAMGHLEEHGLAEVLRHKVRSDHTPLLGICLGMQVLTKKSAEGRRPGLGFIEAETVRLAPGGPGEKLAVPHMGWNLVRPQRESPLFWNSVDSMRFYFAHSYHVVCRDRRDVLGTTCYGGEFTSAFQRDNLVGVQFHPEKSHRYGLRLFRNFVERV